MPSTTNAEELKLKIERFIKEEDKSSDSAIEIIDSLGALECLDAIELLKTRESGDKHKTFPKHVALFSSSSTNLHFIKFLDKLLDKLDLKSYRDFRMLLYDESVGPDSFVGIYHEHQDPECRGALLQLISKFNQNYKNVLHLAVYANSEGSVISKLMDDGADANGMDFSESTPLSLALDMPNNQCFRIILDYPKFVATRNINRAILVAVGRNNFPAVLSLMSIVKKSKLLVTYPDLLNSAHEKQTEDTALHKAVRQKNSFMCVLLMDYGANADQVNYEEKSPLNLAAELEDDACFKALLQHKKYKISLNATAIFLKLVKAKQFKYAIIFLEHLTNKKTQKTEFKLEDLVEELEKQKALDDSEGNKFFNFSEAIKAISQFGGKEASDEYIGKTITWQNNSALIQQKVGKGGYGSVFLALWGGQKVAIKILTRWDDKESNLLKRIAHPCIIRMYDGFERHNDFVLILEYAAKGDLNAVITAGNYSETEVILWLLQMISGLKYLHDNGLIHSDFTLANVLVTQSDEIKIADFGLSITQREVDEGRVTTGTYRYMPPEMLRSLSVSKKVDIYSFALVAWSLWCKQKHWPSAVCKMEFIYNSLYTAITLGLRPPIEKVSLKSLAALIQRCWSAERSVRPEAGDVVKELEKILCEYSAVPQC